MFVINAFITFQVPYISKEAHFGGGIAGLLVAFPLDYARFHIGVRRYLAWLLVPLPVLVSLVLLFQSVSYARVIEATDATARAFYRVKMQSLINTAPRSVTSSRPPKRK